MMKDAAIWILFPLLLPLCQCFSPWHPPHVLSQPLCASTDTSPRSLLELDPTSDQAREILMDELGLRLEQYERLVALNFLVEDWNDRVNLVSRVDCTPATVFGRHVLPSVAATRATWNPLASGRPKSVIDVGTGGGFPGLPLAIAHPDVSFVLLDSVGKKLSAVQDMARQLDLTNVEIHHGRAEEYFGSGKKFDVATGRSVSALPQFCAWMAHLLDPREGQLLYWIGGVLDERVQPHIGREAPLGDLVSALQESDKRILTVDAAAVQKLARLVPGGYVPPAPQRPLSTSKRRRASSKAAGAGRGNTKSRGAWTKSRNNENAPKQRGYENFQRYSSF